MSEFLGSIVTVKYNSHIESWEFFTEETFKIGLDFFFFHFKCILRIHDTITIDDEDFLFFMDSDIYEISREIASLDEFTIFFSERYLHTECTHTCHKKSTPLLHETRSIESISIRREIVSLSQYIQKLMISGGT
jgi:hypothetical protein